MIGWRRNICNYDSAQVKPPTSLCLSPICPAGCGANGQCVKPGTCICQVGVFINIKMQILLVRCWYRHKQSFESCIGQLDIRHKLQKTFTCCSTQDGKIGARCSDSGARETQDGCGYGGKKMQNALLDSSDDFFFQFNMFERRNLPKWKLSV